MNELEAAKVREAAYFDLGKQMEDLHESAVYGLHNLEGYARGLGDCGNMIQSAYKFVDADVESESIDLETAAYAKKVVSQIVQTVYNTQMSARDELPTARGRISGLEHSITMMRGQWEREQRTVGAIEARLAAHTQSPDPSADAPYERQAPVSLKQQRLQEDHTHVETREVMIPLPEVISTKKGRRKKAASSEETSASAADT